MKKTLTLLVGATMLLCPSAAMAADPSTAEAAHQLERYLEGRFTDTDEGGNAKADCERRGEKRRGVVTYSCDFAYRFSRDDDYSSSGEADATYKSTRKPGKRWKFVLAHD